MRIDDILEHATVNPDFFDVIINGGKNCLESAEILKLRAVSLRLTQVINVGDAFDIID